MKTRRVSFGKYSYNALGMNYPTNISVNMPKVFHKWLTHFRTEYEALFITSSNNLLFPLEGGNDSIDRFEAKRKMTMWGIGTYFNRIDGLFEKLNNVQYSW